MKKGTFATAAVLAAGIIVTSAAAKADCTESMGGTWLMNATTSDGTSAACVALLGADGTIETGACSVFAVKKPPAKNKAITGKIAKNNVCALHGNFTIQGQDKVSIKQGLLVNAGDAEIGGGIGTTKGNKAVWTIQLITEIAD